MGGSLLQDEIVWMSNSILRLLPSFGLLPSLYFASHALSVAESPCIISFFLSVPDRSSQTQLPYHTRNIKAREKNGYCLFFFFTKAFHKENYKFLLEKVAKLINVKLRR